MTVGGSVGSLNLQSKMERVNFVDLTASDSEEELSSFGSQATDDGSVVLLVEASNLSSDDESVEEVENSEVGEVGAMIELTIVDYCFDGIVGEIGGRGDTIVSDGSDDEDIDPVE